MIKINVLCKQVKQKVTGGNIYDTYFYECLEKDSRLKIEYVTDEMIGCQNLWFYSFCCWKNRKMIMACDYLFINSSRFSKFLPFLFLLKLKKNPLSIITIHHHFAYRQLSGFKRIIYKWMEINFLRKCDIIITPNPYVREELLSRYPSSKVSFLELSFDKSQEKKSYPQRGNYLYVGTIEKRKGIKYLIESLGCISIECRKNICVNIVGKVVDMGYYKKIQKRIEKLGLKDIVKFHGRLSDRDLDIAYQNADCFIFPSLLEGYGMVIVEAMSYGLPVIAFDNSAIPYTVRNGYNGLLVKSKDVKELSTSIQTILLNRSLREKLSIGALATYDRIRCIDKLNADIDAFVNSTFCKEI